MSTAEPVTRGSRVLRPAAADALATKGHLVGPEQDTRYRSSPQSIRRPFQASAASRTSSTVRRRISPVRVAQSMD